MKDEPTSAGVWEGLLSWLCDFGRKKDEAMLWVLGLCALLSKTLSELRLKESGGALGAWSLMKALVAGGTT